MARALKTWKKIAAVLHDIFRRHWRRALIIRDWFRLSEEALHLVLAGVVGILAGLANWIYFLSNQLVQLLLMGQTGDLLEAASQMEIWRRLLVPTAGGLAAGLALYWGLRLLRSPGLTNLLEVVVAGNGRLSLRSGMVNAVSSLLSISTGASIGREGLIIQISSTAASKIGQIAKWPPYRLRLLVACGAAAGLAAGCNAPIAGAVFAAQIVLGNFSMTMFAPLVVSSVVAAIISRTLFGMRQLYHAPSYDFTRLSELPWFILLGILSGVLGALFLKAMRAGQNQVNRWPIPIYVRLAFAGLVVGAIGIYYPQVWGNGYETANRLLGETHPQIQFVFWLLAAKFVATAVNIGAGTVGGVFTPTLFLGASLGSLFGAVIHQSQMGSSLPTGAFALVGMGSLLAATTHSPLLAILMIFELSLNYSVMPPLMLACVVSTLVARRLHRDSIYTEPLRRKGVELERESPNIGAATELTVGDIMQAPVPPVRESMRLAEIADRFLTSTNNFLPVIDAKDRLVGIIALHDLKEWLSSGHELAAVIAYDVMRPPPHCLTPSQKLSDVLPDLLRSELRNVPVVNTLADQHLVGSVARAEALGRLSEAISVSSSPKV
jgi:CIC family chloride channel protein